MDTRSCFKDLIYKKFSWLKLIFLIIPAITTIYSQPFQISSHRASLYSIDRYTNEVYYKHDFNIYKTELKTLTTVLSEFPTLPIFANRKHLAAYRIDDTIFVKDYILDTIYSVLTTEQTNLYWPPISFSPNDSNLITGTKYFSFKDSSVHDLSFEVTGWDPDYFEWSSDSTIILYNNDNILEQYHLYSNLVDTIKRLSTFETFTGFAFNTDFNILAYSKFDWLPTLNFYYIDTQVDTIIFNPIEQDTTTIGCWDNPIAITSLVWSQNNRKVAFFNMLVTNPGSGLYTFNIDSNQAYRHLHCFDWFPSYSMSWVENDTVVFFSPEHIFGYDTKLITTAVRNETENLLPESINISNYPNPFNPITTINYSIPEKSFVTIIVFDVLGNEIISLVNEEKQAGTYVVEFDGSGLSSGVYLLRLQADNVLKTRKMVLLK